VTAAAEIADRCQQTLVTRVSLTIVGHSSR
jgi:hypothetical protein